MEVDEVCHLAFPEDEIPLSAFVFEAYHCGIGNQSSVSLLESYPQAELQTNSLFVIAREVLPRKCLKMQPPADCLTLVRIH